MRYGLFGSVMAVATVVTVLSVAQGGAQEVNPPRAQPKSYGGCPTENLAFHKCALEKAKTFDPPRTRSGKPDLQGYWDGQLTMAYSVEGITKDEPLIHRAVMPWEVGPPMIVDPPDRRIPYQPWAAPIGRKGVNFQKHIDPRTACGSGGIPRSVQGTFLLLQRDNYMAWLFEDHHVSRTIALDGRPHIGKDIKLWHGDAVGRWEGNTLVIDVTSLNGYPWLDDAGNFYTDSAHIVERLTMIDRDTIHYEITFEDPKAYTGPWKMAWPLTRVKGPDLGILEEACYEGERDVSKFLKLGYRYYFGESWRSRK